MHHFHLLSCAAATLVVAVVVAVAMSSLPSASGAADTHSSTGRSREGRGGLDVSRIASSFVDVYFGKTERAVPIPQPKDEREDGARAREGVNGLPIIINTWPFTDATRAAWQVINTEGASPLDAVETGCTVCEIEQCDGTVGYGGSPNEDGESTLDAMIMDGVTHDVGSVACLKRVKSAISVARAVMEHTTHTLLVGEDATRFAIQMGFKEENLSTPHSISLWESWKNSSCQPNYWLNVSPDPTRSCGPYTPLPVSAAAQSSDAQDRKSRKHPRANPNIGYYNHDTIGMIAIDAKGDVAGGTSTNGASYKIPGRVGDSPITGSGAYVDNEIGGAAATGDGDVMMRFLPSYQAVQNMKFGMTPTAACEDALRRIIKYYPKFQGGVVAVNKQGQFGGAGYGWVFTYSVRNATMSDVTVYSVQPISP